MPATPPARSPWLRRAEKAALAVGTALLLSYAGARIAAETARAEGVAAFREATNDSAAAPRVERPSPTQGVQAFDEDRGTDGAPLAVLRIPSLALEVPVYAGTEEESLSRGAGHIEGTAPVGGRGNTGIAAHRDGFFRKLERIDLEADVLLEIGEQELRYRVSSIEVVQPTDVHVLAGTASPSITLVTCYPFYFVGAAPQRYIVRADAIDLGPQASAGD